MNRMRRARITVLASALAGSMAVVVAGPLAATGSATPAAKGPAAPAAHRAGERRVNVPAGRARKIAVDPDTRDGMAHHPLELQVKAYDVEANPLVSSTTPTGYDPITVRKYLGLTGTGYGQKIAIVTAYDAPTLASDLSVFDTTYGLPAPPAFKKLSQTGSTSVLPAANANWALETSLDVEWAHAIAPKASIYVIEATTSSLADLNTAISYAASKVGASVISNSWGMAGEISSEATYDYRCKLTKSVCVFSTGDSGNPGGYPAYNPWVVAVGGTTLDLATDSTTGAVTVASEAAWGGSGGGSSLYEPKAAHQSALPGTGRAIPDVSYDADPATGFAVYDSTPYGSSSGWFQMGGTSAGAPQWAGIIAAADQLRVAKRKAVLAAYATNTPIDRMGADLYGLTSGIADIAEGSSNGGCGDICSVTVGYDFVTGLGSPRAGIDIALLNAL